MASAELVLAHPGYEFVAERILSFADARALLAASAVCRNLNNLVTTSSPLQLVLRAAYYSYPPLYRPPAHTAHAAIERAIDVERRWNTLDPKRIDTWDVERSVAHDASDGIFAVAQHKAGESRTEYLLRYREAWAHITPRLPVCITQSTIPANDVSLGKSAAGGEEEHQDPQAEPESGHSVLGSSPPPVVDAGGVEIEGIDAGGESEYADPGADADDEDDQEEDLFPEAGTGQTAGDNANLHDPEHGHTDNGNLYDTGTSLHNGEQVEVPQDPVDNIEAGEAGEHDPNNTADVGHEPGGDTAHHDDAEHDDDDYDSGSDSSSDDDDLPSRRADRLAVWNLDGLRDADPDVPMDAAVHKWQYHCDFPVYDIVIRREDNLLAVTTVEFLPPFDEGGTDTGDGTIPASIGMSAQTHFFALIHPDYPHGYDGPERLTPVPHPEAVRPYIEIKQNIHPREPWLIRANNPPPELAYVDCSLSAAPGCIQMDVSLDYSRCQSTLWDWRAGKQIYNLGGSHDFFGTGMLAIDNKTLLAVGCALHDGTKEGARPLYDASDAGRLSIYPGGINSWPDQPYWVDIPLLPALSLLGPADTLGDADPNLQPWFRFSDPNIAQLGSLKIAHHASMRRNAAPTTWVNVTLSGDLRRLAVLELGWATDAEDAAMIQDYMHTAVVDLRKFKQLLEGRGPTPLALGDLHADGAVVDWDVWGKAYDQLATALGQRTILLVQKRKREGKSRQYIFCVGDYRKLAHGSLVHPSPLAALAPHPPDPYPPLPREHSPPAAPLDKDTAIPVLSAPWDWSHTAASPKGGPATSSAPSVACGNGPAGAAGVAAKASEPAANSAAHVAPADGACACAVCAVPETLTHPAPPRAPDGDPLVCHAHHALDRRGVAAMLNVSQEIEWALADVGHLYIGLKRGKIVILSF